MKKNDVRNLINSRIPPQSKEKNSLLKGLQIFSKYCDDLDIHISANHDVIYGPSFEYIGEQLTKKEIEALVSYSWVFDDYGEIWCLWV